MSTMSQIADALEKSGIPFVRVECVADGIEYWGLTVIHENIRAEVRECADWVEMKVWNYTPEQFMNMLVGAGTCENEWAEFGKFKCSKCGLQVDSMSTNTTAPMPIRHCPNCGRRIKEEAE